MEILPFVIIIGVIALVLGIAIANQRAEKKRTEEIREFASQIGIEHFERGDPELLAELACFQLFSKGRRRTITNMLHGEAEGVDLALFDYQYTVGGGKNQHTYRQTVVYIRAEDLTSPEFALGPETFVHRIGNFLGMQDIDFDEFPGFSNNFLLRGPDEQGIRNFFNAERIKFLEKNPTLSIEARGNQLAVFQSAHRSPPDQLQAMMNVGFEVYAVLREQE